MNQAEVHMWPQKRALSPCERVYLTLDRGSPFAIVMHATVSGTLSPDAFREALRLLQSRHWLLNVTIDVDSRQFVTSAGAEPVVHATRERDPERWLSEAEAFMNVP